MNPFDIVTAADPTLGTTPLASPLVWCIALVVLASLLGVLMMMGEHAEE